MNEQVDDLNAAAAWSRESPEYGAILEGYRANQALLAALAEQRALAGLSQRQVAVRMGTSQSALNRLEAGETDPRLSTIQRLATSLDMTIRWELVPATIAEPAGQPVDTPETAERAATADRQRIRHVAAS